MLKDDMQVTPKASITVPSVVGYEKNIVEYKHSED